MDQLPDEIVCHIFGYLDGSDFANLAFASQRLNRLSHDLNDFNLELTTLRSQDNWDLYLSFIMERVANVHRMYVLCSTANFYVLSTVLKKIKRLKKLTLQCVESEMPVCINFPKNTLPDTLKQPIYFDEINLHLIYKRPVLENPVLDFEISTW